MKRYFEIFKDLNKIANGRKLLVIEMFISCCLYNLADLLPPIATSGIIAVITANNFSEIWYYVFLYIVFYMLYFAMLRWNHIAYYKLGVYYQLQVQKDMFEHIVNHESIFNKMSIGKITDTCSDDTRYLIDIVNACSEALMKFIQLIVIFFIFAYYNIFVALISLCILTIYLTYMLDNSRIVSNHYEGTRKYEDKILDILNQVTNNIREVKSLNMMPSLNKKMDSYRKKWSSDFKNKRIAMTNRYSLIPSIVYGGKLILYIFLAYLVIKGRMTIDKLVLLVSYFELTITTVDKMLDYLLELGNYGIRVKRVKNILEFSNSNYQDFGEVDNDYINGLVTFDNVYYDINGKSVLKNISFKAYPNEITAIVGHSGSGKSTIINLLYRLDRVKSGSILVDDVNIYNYTKKVYSSNVSGVYQKPFVFDMSIKENLSLVDSNINNQIEACKRVGLHDYISSLPKGYNTIISRDSELLNDSKKQLLSIARAILTKSEILLFDEITSDFDSETTLQLRDIINDLKIDHTIILVTHKPEIMEIADRVVVLDKGKVISKGKNNDVLEKCDVYKELRNRSYVSISKVSE